MELRDAVSIMIASQDQLDQCLPSTADEAIVLFKDGKLQLEHVKAGKPNNLKLILIMLL